MPSILRRVCVDFGLTMRPLAALLLAAALLCVTGCPAGKHKPAPRIDVTTTLGEGQKKDADIETEARGIVANSTQPDFVAAAGNRILDVLRLSPWSKTEATIKALVAERDTALSSATDLRAQLDKANSRTDQMIRLGLAASGAICIGLGILSAFLAAKVAVIFPGLGPRLSIGIGAIGAGFLFCSFAYGWALRHQNLVMAVFAAAAVGLAALWYSNRQHAKDAPSPSPVPAN